MYEEQIERRLEELGLDPVDRGRYWYIRCPSHEDHTKSAQCFKDGWIHCHAGCPRKHINSLVGAEVVPYGADQVRSETLQESTKDYKEFWYGLEVLSEAVKGVDFHDLNRLGWRRFEGCEGIPAGVFIPYFSPERSSIPFYQIRHGEGASRRFTFPTGSRPMLYGLECVHQMERFLTFTEGARDAAILRICGIPDVGLPSASSRVLLRQLRQLSVDNKLTVVCCGDRDEAGDRLVSSIEFPFIDARTPYGKDVGDLYAKYGKEGVMKYYARYRSNKSEFNEDTSNADETQSSLGDKNTSES